MPLSPIRSFRRFSRCGLAGAVLGAALLSAHARAANNAPMPNIAMDVEKKQTKSEADTGGDNGGGGGGGGGGNKNKSGISTTTSEIYYVITLHNNSNFAASNVEVDYTIYNETRTSGGNTAPSTTVDNITGSETVDIPANTSKDVETSKIPHERQQTAVGGMGGGKKKGNNVNAAVTEQEIKGIYVTAKIGDNEVSSPYEDPPGIKDDMDQKEKDQNSGDSTSSGDSALGSSSGL